MSQTEENVEVVELPEAVYHVIHEGQCPSLSGQSTLSYQFGNLDGDAHMALWFRLSHNSGSGMFSDDWIPGTAIDAVVIGNNMLTSRSLNALYEGRSINSGGFALAVLRDLGLVKPGEENSRHHAHVPGTTFESQAMARMGQGKKARKSKEA